MTDNIILRADQEAGKIDQVFAEAVAKADRLREAYPNGLPIKVSFWGAILSGRFNLVWTTKRHWHPKKGLVVDRSGIKGMPDHEEMPLVAIAAGVPPDIDYVWWIDLVRKFQSLFNFLLGWLFGKIRLLDIDGDMVLIAPGNAGKVHLELVSEPRKTAEILKEFSQTMIAGSKAYQDLVLRRDQKRVKK